MSVAVVTLVYQEVGDLARERRALLDLLDLGAAPAWPLQIKLAVGVVLFHVLTEGLLPHQLVVVQVEHMQRLQLPELGWDWA